MEKAQTQSQTKLETLQRYHQLTSPITSLSTVRNQDTLKEQLRRNASLRLDCIKQRNNKIYAIDTNTSISELKASAVLYQIPEFSAPEVNFQVAEQIKKKVEEVKNEVITHLPQISKSSNYAPRKLDHQTSHRSAVKELEQWLKSKLKQPPTVVEDTIDYKNMIMGVGMKELIRLISRRCNQQGRIAEQIWELTWGICRQIILYLSKRARKCQQVLQEQLSMMRMVSQKEFERLKQENKNLKNKVGQLQEQNKQLNNDLQRIKKRIVFLEEENKNLVFDNFHLQQDFKNLLEENLAIYLEIGDKNKRGWIKKMYKNISRMATPEHSNLAKLYRQKITGTIQNRIQQQKVTQELVQELSKTEIQQIGDKALEQMLKQKKKKAKHKKQRNSKNSINNGNKQEKEQTEENGLQFITQPYEDQVSQDQIDAVTCRNIVENLRQEFKPIDAYVQAEKPVMIHAYASTSNPEFKDIGLSVYSYMIEILPQIGVNTEDLKEQVKNSKKKDKEKEKEKGKQNLSQLQKRQKSKLSQNMQSSKQKFKTKTDKEKSNTLQIVQEQSKQIMAQREDNQVGSYNSHIEEDSRLSLMSNSEFDNFVNKQQETEGNISKISDIQRQNSSKIQILMRQSKVQSKEIKQIPSLGKTESKQIDFKVFDKDLSSQQKKVPNVSKIPYKIAKPPVQKQNISLNKVQNQSSSFESQKKQGNPARNALENIGKKEQDNNKVIQKAVNLTFICSQCNKIFNLDQEKAESQRLRRIEKKATYSPFRSSKPSERQAKKSSILTPSPCSSLKKLALNPIESCRQEESMDQYQIEQKFEGRRMQKQYTRNNSGYIHDIAYKNQIEQQLKSPYAKREQTQQKIQQNEQIPFILTKIEPSRFFISQIMTANRQFISTMNNSVGQTGDNLEQYLQLVKQINSMPENKINMTEKGAFLIIDKNLFPILNQLLVIVRKAVKTNKIPQTIKLFTSLPSIVSNRINRKYGVKILASKHLKAILMAIKAAGRYTDKLKTIQLMMFTDCKSLHSEDFFIYLLMMGLFDPTYTAIRLLNTEESYTIRRICEQHLTRQPQVYSQFQRLKQTKGESMLLGEVVKSIITNYRLLKINRIQELGFIFLMLKKDQNWMNYKDFITFMFTFTIDNTLKINITKKLLQFCDVKNRDNSLGISENMFTKFLTSCQHLNLSLLQSNLSDHIQHYCAEDHQILPEMIEKLFQTVFKIKTSQFLPNNTVQQDSILSASKFEESSSVLEITQVSHIQQMQNQVQQSPKSCFQNIKVAQKLRTYSNFTYKICNYIQRNEQTKFLSARQKKFIKTYLVLHILNCQVQKMVGIVDYFSNSMLGLICTPLDQFSLNSKPLLNV